MSSQSGISTCVCVGYDNSTAGRMINSFCLSTKNASGIEELPEFVVCSTFGEEQVMSKYISHLSFYCDKRNVI